MDYCSSTTTTTTGNSTAQDITHLVWKVSDTPDGRLKCRRVHIVRHRDNDLDIVGDRPRLELTLGLDAKHKADARRHGRSRHHVALHGMEQGEYCREHGLRPEHSTAYTTHLTRQRRFLQAVMPTGDA